MKTERLIVMIAIKDGRPVRSGVRWKCYGSFEQALRSGTGFIVKPGDLIVVEKTNKSWLVKVKESVAKTIGCPAYFMLVDAFAEAEVIASKSATLAALVVHAT
jgi:hypothetical protein